MQVLKSQSMVAAVVLDLMELELGKKVFESEWKSSWGLLKAKDRRISMRGQIVAKKITDEENRTARESHCERTTVVYRGHG